jgi:hypothetical protein
VVRSNSLLAAAKDFDPRAILSRAKATSSSLPLAGEDGGGVETVKLTPLHALP